MLNQRAFDSSKGKRHVSRPVQGLGLDSERGNFKLFGLIYSLNLRKLELCGARLLKNLRV